jgi:hypothetical protein
LVLKDLEDETSGEETMCQAFTSGKSSFAFRTGTLICVALRVVITDIPAGSTFSTDDLQWLYGESYDLALRMLTESRVERVSPLLEASKEVYLFNWIRSRQLLTGTVSLRDIT